MITNVLPRFFMNHNVVTCVKSEIRVLFQKFAASYIMKHNTTTVTSLFFHIISANFIALVPSFLQLLYTSLVEEFILPLKKDLHRCCDVIIT